MLTTIFVGLNPFIFYYFLHSRVCLNFYMPFIQLAFLPGFFGSLPDG
jgi:hypothetical protein